MVGPLDHHVQALLALFARAQAEPQIRSVLPDLLRCQLEWVADDLFFAAWRSLREPIGKMDNRGKKTKAKRPSARPVPVESGRLAVIGGRNRS